MDVADEHARIAELLHVGERPVVDGVASRLEGPEAGVHDDADLRIDRMQPAYDLDAVHVGQTDIHHGHGVGVGHHLLEGHAGQLESVGFESFVGDDVA